MTKSRSNRERRHKRGSKCKRMRAIKGRGKINNLLSVTTTLSLKKCYLFLGLLERGNEREG